LGRRYLTKGGLIRETAYLFEEEPALDERAARDRCSKSEVIRRALRLFLELQPLSSHGQLAGIGDDRDRELNRAKAPHRSQEGFEAQVIPESTEG
jgi:hypothetical protein